MALFKQKQIQQYNEDLILIIAIYLESSAYYELNALRVTEVFAYSYFNLDFYLYLNDKKTRNKIGNEACKEFRHLLSKNGDVEKMNSLFKDRIEEYGQLTRENKQPSDIFEQFAVNLNKTRLNNNIGPINDVAMQEDIFEKHLIWSELSDFDTNQFFPFLSEVIKKSK